MGKQRRKFGTGFKQQIVQEVGIRAAVGRRRQARQGGLQGGPSVREKFLERENRELKEKVAMMPKLRNQPIRLDVRL